MIKALIFDFDGVIHDTLDLAYKINKKLGGTFTLDEYKDFFNGNIYEHKQIFPEKIKEFFELQNPLFSELKIREEIKNELLKLKKKFDLFIVSSNMEAALHAYFKNNDISHIFNEILGVESHKSKVEKFKLLMKKYGLNQEQCVFITDTLGDILEANKVGLKTIAVDFGFHERERLEKGKPLTIVSDFRHLSREVENIIKQYESKKSS